MAVFLGLDLGAKRVGVAITDEAGSMALPLDTLEIRGRAHLLTLLEGLIKDYRAVKIVIGLPKTLKGEIGPAAEKTLEEVEWLKARIQEPIELWDERLTTQEVERVLLAGGASRQKRKEVRDKLAAQRILQSYLDAQRRKTE